MHIEDIDVRRPVAIPYIPDGNHVFNQIVASVHRFGRVMNPIAIEESPLFLDFGKKFIRKVFDPLKQSEIKSFKEWIESTDYCRTRKIQLAKLLLNVVKIDDDTVTSKSFIKFEGYEKPKNARGINSYTDESKAIIGPIQSCVDKKTFKYKAFMKGHPVREWAKILKNTLGDNPVLETDFSSFEAHHHGECAKLVHYWVMHMIRDCGFTNHFKRIVSRMMLGTNVTKFKWITATLAQRLMSGAMWTSSANGVLNLILMVYLNGRSKYPDADTDWLVENVDSYFSGHVEGDDGICACSNIDTSIITRLGLNLEFKMARNYGEAKFCGIICDSSSNRITTDPLKVIRNFFIVPPEYKNAGETKIKSLFRAKALSGKCNFNDCPIIGELYHHVCNLTRSIDPASTKSELLGWRGREQLDLAIKDKLHLKKPVVDDLDRLVVERRFKIPVQVQLLWEHQIRSSGEVIRLALIDFISKRDLDHALDFCSRSPVVPELPVRIPEVVQNTIDSAYIKKRRANVFVLKQDAFFRKTVHYVNESESAVEYLQSVNHL